MNFVLFLLFGLIAGVKTEANNTEEICLMEIDEGPCRGIMRRWAWNPVEEHCEPFEYGGCGGNGNNFDSQLECLDECWNKHVDEKYRKKPEPRCVKYIV
ncbi:hypothetical protein RB195_020264 [Necator americanus]|uniref:BPTI/Kunitz inhibitor domain-containing protein n=1 Tax=Necator americanus TaxID=51031 RepID=A0ABR1CIZ2_NECAM